MKKIMIAMLGGVHRNEGRVSWWPTICYWWALIFPRPGGRVSGRALTPAERERFLAASRRRAK